MATFEETFENLKAEMDKLGFSYKENLFESVAKGLGPALYNSDANTVSCSDDSERETVKKSFLMGKLGMSDSPKLDQAIEKICNKMGSSNRHKYRAIFYYLLVEELGAQSSY